MNEGAAVATAADGRGADSTAFVLGEPTLRDFGEGTGRHFSCRHEAAVGSSRRAAVGRGRGCQRTTQHSSESETDPIVAPSSSV